MGTGERGGRRVDVRGNLDAGGILRGVRANLDVRRQAGGRACSASQAERNTHRTNEGDHRRGAKVEDTVDVGRRLEDSRCTMQGREGAKGEMGRKGTLTGKHARIHAVEVEAVVRHGSDASFS